MKKIVFGRHSYEHVKERIIKLEKRHSQDGVIDDVPLLKTILNVPLHYRKNVSAPIEIFFSLEKIKGKPVIFYRPNFRNLIFFFLAAVGVGFISYFAFDRTVAVFIWFVGLLVTLNVYLSTLLFTRKYIRSLVD